jgi:hypothetical protein
MKTGRRSSDQECRRTEGRAADSADADPTRDAGSAPAPVAVTWARAQLRERIQQGWAALDPAAEPAFWRACEPGHSPLADREVEP